MRCRLCGGNRQPTTPRVLRRSKVLLASPAPPETPLFSCLAPPYPIGLRARLAAGRKAEAEPLYREALAAYRETLGNRHSHTLLAMNGLASLLNETGAPHATVPVARCPVAVGVCRPKYLCR